MATNLHQRPGYSLSVAASHPAAPDSGDPVRYGNLTGVALTDEGDGNNATTHTSVDFGPAVWNLSVDDNEGTGSAVGDPIYYHDTGTGDPVSNLNNTATSMDAYFGVALEVVTANATTTIEVMHVPIGASIAIANGAVTAGMLASDAVVTAKILDANVTEAKLTAALQGTADGLGLLRVARATFDPSANAGERTIAAHTLGVTLPDNAIVIGGFIDVITTFTSAGADAGTIALSVQTANDIVTATAISAVGDIWDAGLQAIVPKSNTPESTGIKLTAARLVTATVAEQALTAGKAVIYLHYVNGA